MRTPPGVSAADFEKAIKQFEGAVGSPAYTVSEYFVRGQLGAAGRAAE